MSVAEWRERFAARRAAEAAERERLRRLRAWGKERRQARRRRVAEVEHRARTAINMLATMRAAPSDRLAAVQRLLEQLMDAEQDLHGKVRRNRRRNRRRGSSEVAPR